MILIGKQKLGDPLGPFPDWLGLKPSIYSMVKIDLKNGNVLNKIYDTTDTVGFQSQRSDGQLLYIPKTGLSYKLSQNTESKTYFQTIDKSMKIIAKDSIKFGVNNYYLSTIKQNNWAFNAYVTDNKGRITGPFISLDTFIDAKVKVGIMPIIDFNTIENNNPKIIKIIDFSDKILLPPLTSGFSPIVYFNGNRIDMLCYYLEGAKARTWMLSHDIDGNELFYMTKLKIDEFNYEAVRPITTNTGIPYYLAWPSRKDKAEFDIITIDNSGSLKFVLTVDMTTSLNSTQLATGGASIMDDVLIVRSIVDSRYSVFFAYKMSELLSSINDNKETKGVFSIHPNPANEVIIAICDECVSASTYAIFDDNGRHLLDHKIENKETSIDISQLISGTYIIKLIDKDGQIVSNNRFIKIK